MMKYNSPQVLDIICKLTYDEDEIIHFERYLRCFTQFCFWYCMIVSHNLYDQHMRLAAQWDKRELRPHLPQDFFQECYRIGINPKNDIEHLRDFYGLNGLPFYEPFLYMFTGFREFNYCYTSRNVSSVKIADKLKEKWTRDNLFDKENDYHTRAIIKFCFDHIQEPEYLSFGREHRFIEARQWEEMRKDFVDGFC